MVEKKGIKELQEASIALLKLSAIAAKHLKDGAQISDIASILSEAVASEEIKAGMDGISEVVAEVKDLSLEEGLALTAILIPSIFGLISELAGSKEA